MIAKRLSRCKIIKSWKNNKSNSSTDMRTTHTHTKAQQHKTALNYMYLCCVVVLCCVCVCWIWNSCHKLTAHILYIACCIYIYYAAVSSWDWHRSNIMLHLYQLRACRDVNRLVCAVGPTRHITLTPSQQTELDNFAKKASHPVNIKSLIETGTTCSSFRI